jgi:hypothetical protein
MKPLENVWSSLVQRRLLPVAILLVAALAAVPFVLSKDPEPVAPAPATPSADKTLTADASMSDPVVALAEDGSAPKQRRRVLGAAKNPFEPAAAPAPTATPTPESATGGSPVSIPGAATGGQSTGGGSSAPASAPAGPVSAPAPTAPQSAPKPTYELYSLTVRFGDSEAQSLDRMNLPRLKALPDADDPVLVYLGPGKGAKTAVFMVDEGVVAQGDASCQPSPANCETLHMHVGDTEFLDVTDEDGNVSAQYQLDLLKIKTSKTADAAKAAKVRAAASKTGRSVLRARQAADGPLRYRYDVKSGTVRKLDRKTFKALQAKTARAGISTAGGF